MTELLDKLSNVFVTCQRLKLDQEEVIDLFPKLEMLATKISNDNFIKHDSTHSN